MKVGAAYIRVSTEDQIEFSPDSQLKKIKEYANQHDIILPDEYIFVDEGISGRYAEKRPQFMRMIATAKTKPKPFDIILLWKFSRFARNRQDSILYKSMLRKNCKIDVVSITEQLSNDPTAILIEALLEAMDEYYSINLAQEVKRGMGEKFSRGGIVSIPAFGYKVLPNSEKYEIDEEKAEIVRMIFNDYLYNNIPTRQIAMKLNNMGILSNRGNAFENRTVEYILSNPIYIGYIRRSMGEVNRKDRYKKGENIKLIKANHSPIISEKVYDEVQKKLQQVKNNHPKYSQNSYTDFMLRGLVRCSCCGSTLTQSLKGKSLQCHRYARGQCKESHSILISKLNTLVFEQIEKDFQKEILNISINNVSKINTDIDPIETLLKGEKKKLERIQQAFEEGIDTLEEYRIKKDKIQKQIETLEKKRKPVEKIEPLPDISMLKNKINLSFNDLKNIDMSENEKNQLLKTFISKIIFDRKSCSIQIYYHL